MNSGEVLTNVALASQVSLGINNFRKGVTAPADGTLGTTPTTPTILFALAAERLAAGVIFPVDMDRTVDAQIVLIWALAAGETNLDALDVTLDYTIPIIGTTGAGPGKASTGATGQIIVTTAEGLAIGDTYSMSINLPRADATNPYTSANAVGLSFEFGLTNVVGVASAHFLAGRLAYERNH